MSARHPLTPEKSLLQAGCTALVFAALIVGAQPVFAQTRNIDAATTAASLKGRAGDRFTLTCPAISEARNSIYGTDTYTADSPICQAALHAGVLKAGQAGTVVIDLGPGASEYAASTRNGVRSRNYGAYSSSYTFVAAEAPTTPDRIGAALMPTISSAAVSGPVITSLDSLQGLPCRNGTGRTQIDYPGLETVVIKCVLTETTPTFTLSLTVKRGNIHNYNSCSDSPFVQNPPNCAGTNQPPSVQVKVEVNGLVDTEPCNGPAPGTSRTCTYTIPAESAVRLVGTGFGSQHSFVMTGDRSVTIQGGHAVGYGGGN